MSKERNEEICRLYAEGLSLHQCCERFQLCHERVRQILRKAGVWRRRGSERDQFLGVNLNVADKEALKAEAEKRGVSMSMLTSDLIKDMLTSREQ